MRQLRITKSITNRDSKSLEKYFHDVGKEELITPEEEVELAKRIKEGDSDALEKLVNANLRFVVSVAKQYQNQGLSLPDLINEGNLGLIKAAQRFDETRGFKFVSYAVWWIRQTILQAIAEQSRIVRLPLNRISALNKMKKKSSEFEFENEREPSPEELAEILELPVEKIDTGSSHISFDAPFAEGEDNTLSDVFEDSDSLSPEQPMMKESLKKEIERVLNLLPEKEAKVVKFSYGIGCTPISLEEIGDIFNIRKERARQIKMRALKILRKRSKNLREYL